MRWSFVWRLQVLCFGALKLQSLWSTCVLKLCIKVLHFLLWWVEALCWSSKFFALVRWSFVLRLQVLCFGALKLQSLWSTCVLKLCIKVLHFLLWWVEALCWGSKFFALVCWSSKVFGQLVCWNFALRFYALCFGVLKLESLWSGVLKFHVETIGPLVGLLGFWRFALKFYIIRCWCFQPLH